MISHLKNAIREMYLSSFSEREDAKIPRRTAGVTGIRRFEGMSRPLVESSSGLVAVLEDALETVEEVEAPVMVGVDDVVEDVGISGALDQQLVSCHQLCLECNYEYQRMIPSFQC